MAISGDYPRPVQVNGYQCHNCAEVSQAKKFIDPAHAKSGPFGADIGDDANAPAIAKARAAEQAGDAVQFGGALSYLNTARPLADAQPVPAANAASSGIVFDRVA